MEVINDIQSITHVRVVIPFGIVVADPFDKVLEFPIIDSDIENGFDFVFVVSCDLDRRRRRNNPVRDCVGVVWFEKGNVEHRVDFA